MSHQSARPGQARSPDRALLERAHRFPCAYVIKVFGPEGETFRGAVLAAGAATLGPGRVRVAGERATRSRDRVCLTLEIDAEGVDDIVRTYDRLHDVEGLLLIL